MIKLIEIEGFKSIVESTIDLGQLTLLTGLNSSGKSSVIQSLLLLEKGAKSMDLYLDGHGPLEESRNPFVKEGISISGLFSNKKVLEIRNEKVRMDEALIFPTITYISADRFGPETSISIDNTNNMIGKKGENLLSVIDKNSDIVLPSALIHPESQGDTYLFNLEAWLGVISPNIRFEHFLQTKSDSSYSTFNGHRAKNVGFGLSYCLPVIAALLLSPAFKNQMVIIENPEAHLHPRGQSELAKLICLCANSGVQVVIETHSDHLFDGIRLFVKNNPSINFNDNISTYWFELDKFRNSEILAIKIDKQGRVKEWPKGMFDQFAINSSQLL